jgi:hypothetical protein
LISEVDKAYAAGFFDGEGYVTITKQSRGDTYYLRVGISNTCREPLEYIQGLWYGSLFDHAGRYDGYNGRHARLAAYKWYAHGPKAAAFLLDLLPYLRVKNEQALLGLEFQDLKRGFGSKYTVQEKAQARGLYETLKATNLNPIWSSPYQYKGVVI